MNNDDDDDDDDDDDFIISVVFNKKIRALLGMFRDQDYRQFHVGEYSRYRLFQGRMSFYGGLLLSKVSNMCVF